MGVLVIKKSICLLFVVLVLCLFAGCSNPPDSVDRKEELSETKNNEAEVKQADTDPAANPAMRTESGDFGKTIQFEGFEVTVSDGYSFAILDNQFSELDGREVVEVPVHIKNNGTETGKLMLYKTHFLGPEGQELKTLESFFIDNDFFMAGYLRPGEEYDTFFHLLYEGDGVYSIEYGTEFATDNPVLKIPISKRFGYNNSAEEDKEENVIAETQAPLSTQTNKSDYGKTILFDGFEITISEEYIFTTVENRYSELNGQEVIELPVHIKNKNQETDHLGLFDYKFFGSKGTQLDSVEAFFTNDIFRAGDLRPEAEYDTCFHLIYDGDGMYYIEFKNYREKTVLGFEITKPE